MPERKVYKDYEESNVGKVFEDAHPTGWQDLIKWLNQHGLASSAVTPGEAAHMIADAKQASKDNVPFSNNPEQVSRIMKSHRNPELVRQEEQIWLAKGDRPNAPRDENVRRAS